MKIDGREIGPDHPPYVIAEISCNHCGSMIEAMKLIEAAKWAGADAVKFQCYEADSLTIDCDAPGFIINDGPWKGRKLHELYTSAQTPFAWFPNLFATARAHGITAFASVFDQRGIDLLEGLDCPAYKIASMEITDIPLIQAVAKTGRPMIISTGMASTSEILDAIRASGKTDVALLHCVSGYPTAIESANLGRINGLIGFVYPFQVGISDHSLGYVVPVAAVAMGATIIEKHLKRDECTQSSEDDDFSLDEIDFKEMVRVVRITWEGLRPSMSTAEESSRQLRRSLYVVKDMDAGETFTNENVRSIRPVYGMAPKHLPTILGKTASKPIKRGAPLDATMIA